MKKNVLKATLVAAFGLIAGFNVCITPQKSDVMRLTLANEWKHWLPEKTIGHTRLFPCAIQTLNECV